MGKRKIIRSSGQPTVFPRSGRHPIALVGVGGSVQEPWKDRAAQGGFDPEVDGVVFIEDLLDPYEEADVPIADVELTGEAIEIGLVMDGYDFTTADTLKGECGVGPVSIRRVG